METTRSGALPSPAELKQELPASAAMLAVVARARAAIRAILEGRDERLLVVVGPCSIHDLQAAREYARRLAPLCARHEGELLICMRSFFEKPRTSVGWKGLLTDPHVDGSGDVAAGLQLARTLLRELAELGLPAAIEALDPLAQRYFADLVSWSAIGARTTESQTHRELASSLATPVGFKNNTDGSLDVALHAIVAAAHAHTAFDVDEAGRICIKRSAGNPHGHLVLRGGKHGPNYARTDVAQAAQKLREHGLVPRVMIDVSHDNSLRDHRNQATVVADVAEQIASSDAIFAVMIESHLVAGKQAWDARPLRYGQSITDGCVDFSTTERMLERLAGAVRSRRTRATKCEPGTAQACVV
jgi:3-deoxy-7-phosphoheptulonate synthase